MPILNFDSTLRTIVIDSVATAADGRPAVLTVLVDKRNFCRGRQSLPEIFGEFHPTLLSTNFEIFRPTNSALTNSSSTAG
ncbi:MAG: hypothetical protein NZ805_08215 [Armatimonadetes bacterium]|nr:hypothetical protein [Armatimonadota bacterium]MDW8027414.1 hypothetical protein [Armatimonadota bacterium]